MLQTKNLSFIVVAFGLLAVLVVPACGGGGSKIDEDFCADLGLEYRETADGEGYCFSSGVDCSVEEDGTACDDGDACTVGDECSGGDCVGSPIAGLDDENPCTADSCDSETGEVTHDAAAMDGSACDDEDVCSSDDVCQDGVCTGDYTVDVNGDPIDDGDDCTRDFCDEDGVRQNEPYTPEEAAQLGLGDVTPEDVANPCMEYVCEVGTGDTPHMNVLDRTDCSDPEAGRTNGDCVSWTCQTGVCAAIVNEQVVESAEVQGGLDLHPACRMRECNTATGQVVYVVDVRKVGEPCDDGNSCTFGTVCHMYGSCGGTQMPHGTPCEDGTACTVGDFCHDGICVPGKDYLVLANEVPDPENPDPDDVYRDPDGIIAAGIECRQYICDPQRGIVVAAVANGTDCDDGNPCTATSTCQDGECFGVRDNTNDGDVCASSANECEEGYCQKGVCVGFSPVSDARPCTGPNPCYEYHCEDAGGAGECVEGNALADGTVCGEVSECQDSICQAGACVPDPDPTTHQGEPCGEFDSRCNAATCDANAVCQPNPVADGTACTLAAEDLPAFGLSAKDLVCNTGECIVSGLGYSVCTPMVTNEGGDCNNNNPCDGADSCQAGLCLETWITDDPDSAEYDNLLPTADSATPCEVDGDPSTVGRCDYTGDCVEISRVVDDTNECTYPEWNETLGAVEMVNKPDGTVCHVVAVNPCVENHGVCIAGECHVTPMPDGTPCNVTGVAVPAEEDLPAGHRLECYAEVCLSGQCVVDTSSQDGDPCDDGETTCSAMGSCAAGACQADETPRGYGETCFSPADSGIVDLQGNPIDAGDVQCWVVFECSETGTCSVAVAMAADSTPCDAHADGDICDGWCFDGQCQNHIWDAAPNGGCDDGNPCTQDQCNGAGGCDHPPLDGPVPDCEGVNPANECSDLECVAGACTAVNDNTNPCDDGNACTNPDECISGQCVGTNDPLANGLPCGDEEDFNTDENCTMSTCMDGVCTPDNAPEPLGNLCGSEGSCVGRGTCDGAGVCSGSSSLADGVNCDTNGIPCDEGCLDIDGPDGDALSECVSFSSFYGLITAGEMAANGNPLDANGWEEQACREQLDLTYDPEFPGSGNTCTRYVCYFGSCHPWNDSLPPDAGLGSNPTNGLPCGDAGECTLQGTCFNNACDSYHHVEDGQPCAEAYCDPTGDLVMRPTCQAGACTTEAAMTSSCSRGLAACLANYCSGGACVHDCNPANFDYANVFEDIAATGTARLTEMRSPYDTSVTCGDFIGSGAATEMERMACDDGSVLLDLHADLGFVSPDGPLGNPEGFWFYNRRYRYVSISANGTVLFHKDHPQALSEAEHTKFIFANVGGNAFDPDAGDSPGDPVNDGTSAAQIRVFFDDLTFISDISEQPPADPAQPYGDFTSFGNVYTKHMPGPDGVIEDGLVGNFDDYLIIQWDRASFFGCALNDMDRSLMTVQIKWWPATGMIAFVYPDEVNSDGELLGPWCLPGRVNGSDAEIGLYDENGAPANVIGERGWLIVNDSGPGTGTFDAYYLAWPTDRPITNYDWRGQEWFVDLSEHVADTGETIGTELVELSNCDDCCQRVDLEQALWIDGQAREFMNVCSDGYVHFMDYAAGQDASLNAGDATMLDGAAPFSQIAPFWSDLRMEDNQRSKVYWLEEQAATGRRVIVQWHLADYNYQIVPFGLFQDEQEKGEPFCSDNADNDGDGLVDCDDSSCACAAACAGQGCGLTFEVVLHADLGMVEFRYLSTFAELMHAFGSTSGVAVGVKQSSGGWHGIDLMDGLSGGDMISPDISLDPADMDEIYPVTQMNVILPQNGFLTPYSF